MNTENEAFVSGLIDSITNHRREWNSMIGNFSTQIRAHEKYAFIHIKTDLHLFYAVVDSGDLLVLHPEIEITDFENKKIRVALAATLVMDVKKKKELEDREKYLKKVGPVLNYFSKNDNIPVKL